MTDDLKRQADLQHRADLFNSLRTQPESDASLRQRILESIVASFFPVTVVEIQTAIGADLDRLAAHFDLERKSNV